MQWSPGDRSNIEDDRASSGGGMRGVGMPIGIGGFVVLLLLSWATGTDFLGMLTGGGAPGTPQSSPSSNGVGTSGKLATTPAEEKEVDLVDAVMKDVQDTWAQVLPGRYQRTRAVLFRDNIDSACGFAQAATGPFYCPEDGRVYLDLGFFDELKNRFGAPGDFAQAYVLAHEVGHHIQRLTGVESRATQGGRPTNAMSIAMELQADCYAGVWGHTASQPGRAKAGKIEIDRSDVEEGLNAAAAIGDDRLQKMLTGRVMPERFTHGTSAQRVEWFRRGMGSGDPAACDTFTRATR